MLGHVQRGHRHDQDHHDLAEDQRRDRREDGRAAKDLRKPRWRSVIAWRIGSTVRVRELVRVGPQQDEGQDRRHADEHHRHEYGPVSTAARVRGDLARERDELRPDDRADGRSPDDEPERRGPASGRHHVRGGVARQLVRAVAEPDQQRAEEQQRQRPGNHRDRRDDRADDADGVAERRALRAGRGGP